MQLPAYIWSEEYQRDLFSKHFEAFDTLRRQGWFIGEFIWNFADFKTAQSKYPRGKTIQFHHNEINYQLIIGIFSLCFINLCSTYTSWWQ